MPTLCCRMVLDFCIRSLNCQYEIKLILSEYDASLKYDGKSRKRKNLSRHDYASTLCMA